MGLLCIDKIVRGVFSLFEAFFGDILYVGQFWFYSQAGLLSFEVDSLCIFQMFVEIFSEKYGPRECEVARAKLIGYEVCLRAIVVIA